MKPEHWYQDGQYLGVRGRSLFVREQGRGTALLCLHGTPGCSWSWHKVADALAKRYRLILPDMLGAGHSDKPPQERYSIVSQADRVEALLKTLDISSCLVMGQGLGGMVATELLARSDGRLRDGVDGIRIPGAVLINPPLFPEQIHPPAIQSWLAGRLGGLLKWAGNRNLFWQYLNAISGPYSRPTPPEVSQLWRLTTHGRGRLIWPEQLRYPRELIRRGNRWIRALRDTETPLRVLAGAEDPLAGHRMEGSFRRELPGLRRTMLRALGHTPQFEAPDKLLPELETALKDITPP
jgi:pimeloyl-ACP methyl ester carboxylesterase